LTLTASFSVAHIDAASTLVDWQKPTKTEEKEEHKQNTLKTERQSISGIDKHISS
jgi:hypothetical protein|tara:strand:- start:179 stop:343 length:165 start_codon:yes stop_codon:yes gene_type:complete